MCTLIILRQPGQVWPLMLAANRDEMAGRPWKPPGRHWPDRPDVVAGLDEQAGGSWLGINDHGVVAGILNRVGSLGALAGKRSRGELVLEALDHADAALAAKALSDLDPRAYRPFNLMIADSQDAFWLKNDGRRIETATIPKGLHMLTAHDLDDMASPRIQAFLPRFKAAPLPSPDKEDWTAWKELMATRAPGRGSEDAALLIEREDGFGTVSSALIALPQPNPGQHPLFLFAPGPPDRTEFTLLPPSG
ncbi:MAG: NRDE family protein [Alphaproteobacteria bacterium]|nr:NRDE family protein [Alphaproteobacteria bacterium]